MTRTTTRRQPMPPASWTPNPTIRDVRPILPLEQIERDTRRVTASRIQEMASEEVGYHYPSVRDHLAALWRSTTPRGVATVFAFVGLLFVLVML